ncbi:NinE family protein [Yersinia massiliensis]|uniref:NinE family protein n=1 Tax=Yersinia massiliensis TaxID=419257 RepID=A0ABM6UVS1_9GAMM|nr:NinE family protein [Yersinia massiliensis]
MRQISPTQIALDNLKFKVSHRTKPAKQIPASQIKTFDYVHGLLQAKFDRVRRTR